MAFEQQAPGVALQWIKDHIGIVSGTPGPTGPAGTNGTDGTSINWLGAWSGATAYVANDAVDLAGSSYICILGHTNHTPPNATYWDVLAEKGADGSGGGSTPIADGTWTPSVNQGHGFFETIDTHTITTTTPTLIQVTWPFFVGHATNVIGGAGTTVQYQVYMVLTTTADPGGATPLLMASGRVFAPVGAATEGQTDIIAGQWEVAAADTVTLVAVYSVLDTSVNIDINMDNPMPVMITIFEQ